MGHRRLEYTFRSLEYTFIEDIFDSQAVDERIADPRSWHLLANHLCNQADIVPTRCLKPFTVWFDVQYYCWLDVRQHDDKYLLYKLQSLDGDDIWFEDPRIAVREVPSGPVLNCELSVKENAYFDVICTTMAGSQILHLHQQLLPPTTFTSYYLTQLITEALCDNGQIQSQNQQVHVLLNGAHEELSNNQTVLWNKCFPDGLLQRC